MPLVIICNECGSKNPASNDYCDQCGAALPDLARPDRKDDDGDG